MQAVIYHLNAEAISFFNRFLGHSLLPKLSDIVEPSLLSASKDQINVEGSITLHLRIGDPFITVQFTVALNLFIDVLVGTDTIKEHVLAILSEEEIVSARKTLQSLL